MVNPRSDKILVTYLTLALLLESRTFSYFLDKKIVYNLKTSWSDFDAFLE